MLKKNIKYNVWRDVHGAVLPLIAVSILALVVVIGASVDMGRYFMVKNKLQNAADAALLGAVRTASQTNVQTEFNALFAANYPTGFMGATITNTTVGLAQGSTCRYTATVTATLPMMLMQIVNAGTQTISVAAAVEGCTSRKKLSLALLLDGSAPLVNGNTMHSALIALGNMMDTIGQQNADPALGNTGFYTYNIRYSVVWFNAGVNYFITSGFYKAFLRDFYALRLGTVMVSNRNFDAPRNGFVTQTGFYPFPRTYATTNQPSGDDITDAPPPANCNQPGADQTLCFRIPHGNTTGGWYSVYEGYAPAQIGLIYSGNNYLPTLGYPMWGAQNSCGDYGAPLPKIQFNGVLGPTQNPADVYLSASDLITQSNYYRGGCTRINVGLMWGWYTLSPKWRPYLQANGYPGIDIPRDKAADHIRAAIIVTNGVNNVFLGDGTTITNDNTETLRMCEAMRNDGILIYAIGVPLGSNSTVNSALLTQCTNDASRFFQVTDAATATAAATAIQNSLSGLMGSGQQSPMVLTQ